MNQVIGGSYQGGMIAMSTKTYGLQIVCGIGKSKEVIPLDKYNIEGYEVVNATSKTSSTSAVGRAIVGTALLGPIGAVAALGAKKKSSYQVAVQFKDGKRSLIEFDQKLYEFFVKSTF